MSDNTETQTEETQTKKKRFKIKNVGRISTVLAVSGILTKYIWDSIDAAHSHLRDIAEQKAAAAGDVNISWYDTDKYTDFSDRMTSLGQGFAEAASGIIHISASVASFLIPFMLIYGALDKTKFPKLASVISGAMLGAAVMGLYHFANPFHVGIGLH